MLRLTQWLLPPMPVRRRLYDLGEDITLCWSTNTSATTDACDSGNVRVDCEGAYVGINFMPAVDLDGYEVLDPLASLTDYSLNATVFVPPEFSGLEADGRREIPHFNLHSCFADIGLCTPFISNTPELSTHTAVHSGFLSPP